MKGIGRLRAGVLATLAITGASIAAAQEVTVQNDNAMPPTVTIVGDFAVGERAAAWLTSPCDGTIVAVQVSWFATGAAPDSLEQSIRISSAGTFPNPGSTLFTIAGPLMVAGGINEFRDDGMSNPVSVPVTMGQTVVVDLQYANSTNIASGQPSIVRDMDGCQAGRNAIFATPPGAWFNACSLGITGDLVIRMVVDCIPPAPDVTFDTTSLMFGDTPTDGTGSTLEILVTNDGNASLTVNDPSMAAITGTDLADFSVDSPTGNMVLAPTNSGMVVVRFAPTTDGAKTATLTLTTNDADEASVPIALEGVGVPPTMASEAWLLME